MIIPVNGVRLINELEEHGLINWKEGEGLDQAAFSSAFFAARDYVQELMEDAGLKTRIDPVGNLFGRFAGKDPCKPVIMTGSHLDAVAGGGLYDGMLGVFAALEAVRAIKESCSRPEHDIEVAAFNAEEGGPFGGTFGSRCFCGLVEDLPSEEAMKAAGITKEDITASAADPEDYLCFLETHIEQGPVLERKGIKIGIPTGIVGVTRLRCIITGVANHAGTTPMKERLDAYRVMAEATARWIMMVSQTPDTVCNIAELRQEPGQIGVVTGRMSFTAEIRAPRQEDIDKAAGLLVEILQGYRGFGIEVERMVGKPPADMDQRIVETIETVGKQMRITTLRMPSGASHDASPLSKIIPSGMIFVPSVNGISHSKEEFSKPDDLIHGAWLLANTILEIDRRGLD